MSLKDAIREAVDERDKQQGEQEKTASAQTAQGDSADADKLTEQQSREAVKPESSKAVKPESSEAVKPAKNQEEEPSADKVELAALTIRVSRQSRIHWLVSAKQQNTTLTAAIIEALNARFGEAGS